MPVELEYKFVIEIIDNVEQILLDNLKEYGHFSKDIHQIYLKGGGRVRSVVINEKTTYEFNYKEPLGSGYGCLEIEKNISKNDFELAKIAKVSELTKTRIVLVTKNHTWEIDIFKDNMKQPYFVMMECEVTNSNIPDLTELPDFIRNLIIHEVKLDDTNFTSKKLENITTAKNIYESIQNGLKQIKEIILINNK